MTVLYCCLFFPLGVVLVAVTYTVVMLQRGEAISRVVASQCSRGRSITGRPVPHGACTSHQVGSPTVTIAQLTLGSREFLVGSCIILVAIMAATVLLGWLAAGRVLRPLRVMTIATR